MQPINKKPMSTPENNFYGVDVNNKAAVEAEYERLRRQHRNVTIFVIILLLILGFFIFDFIRVTELGGIPIFVIEEKVEEGTKFKGLGYEVLYCNNGERHAGPTVFKKCTDESAVTIDNFVYKKFVDYAVETKMLNKNNLDTLEFNLVEYDGTNDNDGGDYHVNLKYTCNENKKCLTLVKEYESSESVDLYVRFNKFNEVYDVTYFKVGGSYYDKLVAMYTENLKTYLVENNKLDLANLRSFELDLEENHGKYKFRGNTYSDSYLVKVKYMCVDNGNTCVHAIDDADMEGDFTNLMFFGSMFVDKDGKVMLFGPKEYFDL
jgi:hypothetical protein